MKRKNGIMLNSFLLTIIIALLITSCVEKDATKHQIYGNDFRLSSIPEDAVKALPEDDLHPPVLHSDEFTEPVPLDIISTAGAEDSPFIPADSDGLYFMFIKDVREEPAVQVRDKVNGIWVSKLIGGKWAEPKLVILQKEDELALNGAEFIYDDEMIFASAREGYTGLHWFLANRKEGKWVNWNLLEFEPAYEVGELHIHDDTIYFHSYMDGGKGSMDIWAATIDGNKLSNLENLSINTEDLEGWPYISPDGSELWYTGLHRGVAAVYRSKKTSAGWDTPELILSQFAGEPTLDKEGNLYFVHHYFKDGVMLEADIYIAYRTNNQ